MRACEEPSPMDLNEEEKFKVRDSREKGWFYADDVFLNGYARIVGPIGVAVYMSLCRHANAEQRSFLSLKNIAEDLGIGTSTAKKYIFELEQLNIIAKRLIREKESKQWSCTEYVLLHKEGWKKAMATSVAAATWWSVKGNKIILIRDKEDSILNKQDSLNNHNKLDSQNSLNSQLDIIYHGYKQKIRSGARLTDNSKKKVIARLKQYTLEELLLAIDKFSKDEWRMKNNAHYGMHWFFKNEDQVEKWLNLQSVSSKVKPAWQVKDGKVVRIKDGIVI